MVIGTNWEIADAMLELKRETRLSMYSEWDRERERGRCQVQEERKEEIEGQSALEKLGDLRMGGGGRGWVLKEVMMME